MNHPSDADIRRDIERTPPDVVARNAVFASSILADVCGRRGTMHGRIAPLLPGIRLLTEVVPIDNLLFASEMLGAVPGIDPETGHPFDDTRRYIDQVRDLDDASRHKIFEGNARRVYPRLNALLEGRGQPAAATHRPGASA